jgi:hypothetical protein
MLAVSVVAAWCLALEPSVSFAAESWTDQGTGDQLEVGVVDTSKTSGHVRNPALADSADAPVFEWSRVPDCDGNGPESESSGCAAALACPGNESVVVQDGTAAAGEGSGSGVQVWLRVREYRRQTAPQETGWGYVRTRCVPVDSAEAALGPSVAELVLREWRRVRVPAGAPQVQPPGGVTLVNLDTIVFTDVGEPGWPLRLLGHDVVLRAVPARYRWRFGDGAELVTRDAGAPYPEQTVWHVFREPGRSWVAVDVTFGGQYQVDGGSWQQIPGTVTRVGEPVGLRVVQQRTELVAGSG